MNISDLAKTLAKMLELIEETISIISGVDNDRDIDDTEIENTITDIKELVDKVRERRENEM